MAALDFALSVLRNVTVGGKLLKNVASRKCTFLNKRYVGNGSLKMMLIPYINIVYGRIYLKNNLIIDNEAH
jgi:hypothetical protein